MILEGNCREVLKAIKDCSVDTIITDPPYGLSFMGKTWDYDVPDIDLWKECLRVLKPGGTALIFAGSRTQHRMACNVEDAGFILKDTIMWLYGSGFPKATDISKQIDKMNGDEREVVKIDNRFKGKKPNVNAYAQDRWTQENWKREIEITQPAGEKSILWNGWKSHGLKPSYEPILLAVKPNEGSYAQNALKWGVSGLWIDGGRIPLNGGDTRRKKSGHQNKYVGGDNYKNYSIENQADRLQGRYPANLILDEEAGRLLDQQSGVRISRWGKSPKTEGKNSMFLSNGHPATSGFLDHFIGDSGGASRFFYTAKASKGERNAGCEGLEGRLAKSWHFKCKICGKTYSEQKYKSGCHCKNPDIEQWTGRMTNNHPTVKPIKLMEYLCKITKTPTGGIVLDPFMGSGTTGIACILTGRDFIGIEREQEYIEIAKARIEYFESNNNYQLELQEVST